MIPKLLPKPMAAEELEKKLSAFSPLPVILHLNQNVSTYLSVLEKKKSHIKISLHKLFLQAEDEVCKAVIRYSFKRDKNALKQLRIFSNICFSEMDYSKDLASKEWKVKGSFYDLQEIYRRINTLYFADRLSLRITWFPKPRYKKYSSLTFGSYMRHLRLVRINEILDHPKVPEYFIDFVVYHEMLHDDCPPMLDRSGRLWIHTPLFKKREKEFSLYKKAKEWEEKHYQSKRGWQLLTKI